MHDSTRVTNALQLTLHQQEGSHVVDKVSTMITTPLFDKPTKEDIAKALEVLIASCRKIEMQLYNNKILSLPAKEINSMVSSVQLIKKANTIEKNKKTGLDSPKKKAQRLGSFIKSHLEDYRN